MTPQGLRAWALVFLRDIATPVVGLFLCVWLPVSGNFQPWQLPLLAGMLGVPLVARGDAPAPATPEHPTPASRPLEAPLVAPLPLGTPSEQTQEG